MPILITTSASYISGCGPAEPARFDSNKEIDLVSLLPSFLKESETNDLIQFFQDFLNTMYDEKIYTTSATEYEIENRQKISVLEKINRIKDLHDPDYIDIEYIQYFANYLGYNVDVNRGELGVLTDADSEDPCVQEDSKRYLRFIISNLPNWYKIKTTDNAIKIMLYSFGLIGDLITRFTKDYRTDDGTNWINFREGRDSYKDVSSDFYLTSHYVVSIELDESTTNFSLSNVTRFNVLNAIESIRPANTVFDRILGHVKREETIVIYPMARKRLFLKMSL
jgi:hypothetical protein